MCTNCNTIQAYSRNQVEGYDPTRTLTLRTAFVNDFKRRFTKLSRLVTESIVGNDCFGLTNTLVTNQTYPAGYRQYAYLTNEQKAQEFMMWFNSQVDALLFEVRYLEQIGSSLHPLWYNKYLFDSYKRGLIRARAELRKTGKKIPDHPVALMMQVPIHIETLGILYSRVFSLLKGITAEMDTLISITLTQGLADGDGAAVLTRKLLSVINGSGNNLGVIDSVGRYISARRRAETLARTETIRAHHRATINEYKNWSTLDVYVKAELLTAGDERVCEVCSGLEGQRFSLDEAVNLIPVHPNCRCICLPYQVSKAEFYGE